MKKIANLMFERRVLFSIVFICIFLLLAFFYFEKKSNNDRNSEQSLIGQKAIITIAFDDDDESIYSIAYPIMKQLNLKGTNYCITNFIGRPGMLTKKQLDEMYNDGWTIGNHTTVHWNMETRNDTDIVNLVRNAKIQLNQNGWVKGSGEFAAPDNKIDDRILALIKPYINSSTDDQEGFNNLNYDKYHINRMGVGNKSPAAIEAIIDSAIQEKKYLHLNFHKIGPEKNPVVYSEENFKLVMRYIAEKRDEGLVDVETMYEINNK